MTGNIFLETNEISVGETDNVVLVPVVRTGDLSGVANVQIGVTSDTATAGSDYIAVDGIVTFQSGQDRVLVSVDIVDDNLSESTEDFIVSLINVDSGTLQAPRTTRVGILDDENPVVDPPTPPLESDYSVVQETLIDGLTNPIAMEFSPNDSSIVFIAEKGGKVRVFDTDTDSFQADFLDLSTIVNERQDRGLLDIAFHPNFPDEPYVYAFYVVDPAEAAGQTGNAGLDGGGNRYAHVVRFTADAATNFTSVVPNSAEIIAGGAGQSAADISGGGAVDSTSNLGFAESGLDANGNYIDDYIKVDSRSHAGGSLEFGPDGALYISIGDGTSFNAVDQRSLSVQDINSLSGKILRVDPLTGQGLTDNPFYQAGDSVDSNSSKVYQLGLRNPFSMSFDVEGRLIITDTGWNAFEEINSGGPGANFGWPFYEGGSDGQLLQTGGYRDLPAAQAFYAEVAAGNIDITAAYAGFSHTGSAPGFQVQSIVGADDLISSGNYPDSLQNHYIFVDFSQGEVYAIDSNDRRDVKFLYQADGGFGPVHFKQGPDGFVYAVDLVGGAIRKLVISEPTGAAPILNGTLAANFFNVPGDVSDLDQVNFAAAPIHSETVTEIQNLAGSGAFYTGGPTDLFAARYQGSFNLPNSGAFTFYLNSDDGAELYIDGNLVVDNDGLHADRLVTSTIALDQGAHTIDVRYFERTGFATLDLDWSGANFARTQLTIDPTVVNENVTSDVPFVTQFLNGIGDHDVFSIDGASANYNWGPTEDGTGIVVWGSTGFDLLFGYETIRFSDQDVDIAPDVPVGNEFFDDPSSQQSITGTVADETFVVDGLSTTYQWGPTLDGTGTVIWNAQGFDLLFNIEHIRFNDRTVDLVDTGVGQTFNDDPNVNQSLTGGSGVDRFVYAANSTDYNWGPTLDGAGVVIWNATNFDLLFDFEEIAFDDQTVQVSDVLV